MRFSFCVFGVFGLVAVVKKSRCNQFADRSSWAKMLAIVSKHPPGVQNRRFHRDFTAFFLSHTIASQIWHVACLLNSENHMPRRASIMKFDRTNPNHTRLLLWAIVCLGNLWLVATDLQAQGRLSQVRKNVRRHQSSAASQNNHHGDDSSDHDHDDNDHDHAGHPNRPGRGSRRGHNNRRRRFGSHLNMSFATCPDTPIWSDCLANPCVQPIHVYEPVVYQPVLTQTLVPVPSAAPTNVPVIVENWMEPDFGNYFSSWTGRVTGFYGSNFDDLTHGSLAALLQAPGFLGLDTSVNMFRENGTSFRDHLWLGDVNIVYEAINSDDLRARVGVGINWLGDYYGGEAGANLTFGLDWQINDNWVLTGETDLGNIGDTDLFHAQLSLGRRFDRAEWTTGYDHYDVGGVTMGGLFTGLRFRF